MKSGAKEVWRSRSNQVLLCSANNLAGHSREAEKVIRQELARRGMEQPPEIVIPAVFNKPANAEEICMECRQKGCVTRGVVVFEEVSSLLALSAIMSFGTTLLTSGLKKEAKWNEVSCSRCGYVWYSKRLF